MQKLTKTKERLIDKGLPYPQDSWPQSRNRKDYESLLLQQSLPHIQPLDQDISFDIPEGSTIVDRGLWNGGWQCPGRV